MSKIKSVLVMLAGLLSSITVAQDGQDGRGATHGLSRDYGAQRTTLEQSVVDGCLMCHRDAMSFRGRDPAELREAIERIEAGRAEHVVPIPELSDADRALLAEALAGAEQTEKRGSTETRQ